MIHYLIKLFLSAAVIATVTEIAKRNNFAASIIHSLGVSLPDEFESAPRKLPKKS